MRSPTSNGWINIGDLPLDKLDALWTRQAREAAIEQGELKAFERQQAMIGLTLKELSLACRVRRHEHLLALPPPEERQDTLPEPQREAKALLTLAADAAKALGEDYRPFDNTLSHALADLVIAAVDTASRMGIKLGVPVVERFNADARERGGAYLMPSGGIAK